MKIPLEWLKDYVAIKKSPKEIGTAFTAFGLMVDKPFDGKTFDLEHRFDRSDWLSILGCARDLAAYERLELKLPKVYAAKGKAPTDEYKVAIKVECPEIIRRFNTRVFRNVKVGKSPEWLKTRLEDYGIPSINNIVDITNYVMVELGQPMHAQDTDKFRKMEICIRRAGDEEKIVTFLGDEVKLYPEAFVLAQDEVTTVLGGIVGGRETGVDEQTKNIVLDAGNYDQVVIRKVSRKLKILNESSLRYDKYLHPDLTEYAIQRAAYLILELAGGDYYENEDWYPIPQKLTSIRLSTSRIKDLGGLELAENEVLDILERLGYRLVSNVNKVLTLEVPYFRTDVEVADDIVSDILRIHGYAKIPITQLLGAPPKEETPAIYTFEDRLRDILVKLKGHEHITDPLVSSTESPEGGQIILENSLNSEKNALRTSIAQGLEHVASNYYKNQMNSGVLFEIGLVYHKESEGGDYESYKETRCLECLTFDKAKTPKNLSVITSTLFSGLLKELGLTKPAFKNANEVYVENTLIATLRYNGFTGFTANLLQVTGGKRDARVLFDLQSGISLDTSLTVSQTEMAGAICSEIAASSDKISESFVVEEYTGEKVEKGKRTILIRTYFTKGVTQKEATKILNKWGRS